MSGNVLEWTHSLKKTYPYNVKDGREDEKSSNARVLRGGSFYGNGGARAVRAASATSLLTSTTTSVFVWWWRLLFSPERFWVSVFCLALYSPP
jgi:formylglycine-generating enzyme required for sulfatase activity